MRQLQEKVEEADKNDKNQKTISILPEQVKRKKGYMGNMEFRREHMEFLLWESDLQFL